MEGSKQLCPGLGAQVPVLLDLDLLEANNLGGNSHVGPRDGLLDPPFWIQTKHVGPCLVGTGQPVWEPPYWTLCSDPTSILCTHVPMTNRVKNCFVPSRIKQIRTEIDWCQGWCNQKLAGNSSLKTEITRTGLKPFLRVLES